MKRKKAGKIGSKWKRAVRKIDGKRVAVKIRKYRGRYQVRRIARKRR